ncbi:hypothetical protein Leryth_007148 [Lithospermum erythrorhizon]|nr:hypothetical protein Leryth_007148 [Lithospermum erythrorhizon]
MSSTSLLDRFVSIVMERHSTRIDVPLTMLQTYCSWSLLLDNLIQNWIDSPATIIPLLRESMTNGLRVWIFRLLGISLLMKWQMLGVMDTYVVQMGSSATLIIMVASRIVLIFLYMGIQMTMRLLGLL